LSIKSVQSCSICYIFFKSVEQLKDHIQSKHTPNYNFIKIVTFDCYECKYPFRDRSEWKNHMVKHHETTTSEELAQRCSLCPEALFFETDEQFKDHLLTKHIPQSQSRQKITFDCNECHYPFHDVISLKNHIAKHKAPQVAIEVGQKCCLCTKSDFEGRIIFKSDQQLKEHINVKHAPIFEHPDKGIFYCNECQYPFVNKIEFKNHILKHDDTKKSNDSGQKCSLCTKHDFDGYLVFKSDKKLKEHIENKHVQHYESWDCEKCDFKYSSATSLGNHMNEIHINPFQCELCQKQFSSRYVLKNHIDSIHTADGVCADCVGFKIGDNDGIQDKPNENKFICKICNYKALSRSFLRRHICNKHKKYLNINFYCDICDEDFDTISSMEKHMTVLH